MKRYKISLISLILTFIFAMSAFAFTIFASADDDQRLVSLNGTNVFYANVDGAAVSATRETVTSGETTTTEDYALFEIEEGETITYRKNLAYSWYTEDGNQKFSITFGFKNADFETYTIKFESQQYNKTKDNISTNYLIFKPNADKTGVYATISQDKDAEVSEGVAYSIENNTRITLSFDSYSKGDYTVKLTDGTVTSYYTMTNIKETYAKYVSSGTSAVMPLTFSATFSSDAGEDAVAKMALYDMNGQSFKLVNVVEDTDGTYSGGSVVDDQAPVLCLDSNVNYLTFGSSISLSYTVIDVIASSPRSTLNYYILDGDSYAKENLNYNDVSSDGLFNEISSSTSVKLLRDKNTFIPSDLIEPETADGDDPTNGYEVFGLAKVYLKLTDSTATGGQSTNVFLDWYVSDDYKVNIHEGADNSSDFIMVVEDTQGATYAKTTDLDRDAYEETIKQIEESYQEKINEAIAALKDDDGNVVGKLYAGSSNYFYLPDFSEYVVDGETYNIVNDNLNGYTDFNYSIYYKASSKSSNTSLASNQLAINITEADVTYKFTIIVTDPEGNSMVYPTVDETGKVVYKTITTSDVWDSDFADLLPYFTFSVSYKPATVEDPGTQTIAYVGSTYNNASFDITGVSDTYSTAYKLYTFDRTSFNSDHNLNMSYEDFIANVEALFNNNYEGIENTRKYFTTITPSSDLLETDDDYDTLVEYEWDNSGVTFVPQSTDEYYVIQLTLTDTRSSQNTIKFMAIRASAQADSLTGESDWLENNVASVVLLCIAGVSFIALIVLLIVKPKDKGDIDTIDLDEKKTKKNKKAKKSADIDE
jgi:hypothetical protein